MTLRLYNRLMRHHAFASTCLDDAVQGVKNLREDYYDLNEILEDLENVQAACVVMRDLINNFKEEHERPIV